MRERAGDTLASETAGITLHAFEVLFRVALGEHRELVRRLVPCGFDVDHPLDLYPSEVWLGCVELSRASLFPDRSREAGLRGLGSIFGEGLSHHPIGIAYAGIQVTREAYLACFPRYLRKAWPGIELQVIQTEARCWRVEFQGPCPTPHFMAGLLEARLRERAAPAHARVLLDEPRRYQLEIGW